MRFDTTSQVTRRVSRRAFLIGAASVGCGGAVAQQVPNASLVGANAAEHWSVRYTGVAPEGMFVRRGPITTAEYLFHWHTLACSLSDARNAAPEAEIFSYPGELNDLCVLRGMAAYPPPAGGCYLPAGRAASGAAKYSGGAYPDPRLFILPDGTWVYGDAPALDRLGAELAVRAVAPPVCGLEPGAVVAQQDIGTQKLLSSKKIPNGLVGREAVLARTIAVLPGPPRVSPVIVKFHFPDNAHAEAAAQSLAGLIRSGASRDDAWSSPSKELGMLMGSVNEARAEGNVLVLLGR